MKWIIREISKGLIPLPEHDLYCPLCGSKLWLHDFWCRQYSRPGTLFYHVDVHMKCRECSFYVTFGVPLTLEEYEKLRRSPLHGRVIIHELREIFEDEEDEKVLEKRLKRWGYW